MKLIRDHLIHFNIKTQKTELYVCQSTVDGHKNEIEIHGNFTLTSYDRNNKPTVIKSTIIYLKNNPTEAKK